MMGNRWNDWNESPRHRNDFEEYDEEDKMSLEQIKDRVEDVIDRYGEDLEIADIFIYKDSEYYVSIEEKDTGKGAMELLVNPYNGDVYQEYGPGMMWNEKYGMHGGRGHMGFFDEDYSKKNIERDAAIKIADEYVKNNVNKSYKVIGEGHEFYGYYTFHIEEDNETVGMISVNYNNGDPWYHDWHGELEKVISHEENK